MCSIDYRGRLRLKLNPRARRARASRERTV